MNIADLITMDNLSALSAELLDLLAAFGFVSVKVSRDKSLTHHFCVIEAMRPAGQTNEVWSGIGLSPDEAAEMARDDMTRWILNQPVPSP